MSRHLLEAVITDLRNRVESIAAKIDRITVGQVAVIGEFASKSNTTNEHK